MGVNSVEISNSMAIAVGEDTSTVQLDTSLVPLIRLPALLMRAVDRLRQNFGRHARNVGSPRRTIPIRDIHLFRALAGKRHNLSPADLRGLSLETADDLMLAVRAHASLRGVVVPAGLDLRGVDLSNADLHGASLIRADFRDAHLTHASLRWTDLTEADLRGASLHGADLQGARLHRADLRGADLEDANLRAARLSHARLQSAKLRRARLDGAWLRGADLSGADLTSSYLPGAELWDADLSGAVMVSACGMGMPHLAAAMRGALRARLSPSTVSGAQFSLDGDLALRLVLQGEDLSGTQWPSNASPEVVRLFLVPLVQAIAGTLQDGPDVGELLERRCNHWQHGRSVLTSIDSIGDGSLRLKVALMQQACAALAACSDTHLSAVAGPLLEVLNRQPLYLLHEPRLAGRLVRTALVDCGDRSARVDLLARNEVVLRAVAEQVLKELRSERCESFATDGAASICRVLEALEKITPSADLAAAPSHNRARDIQYAYERQLIADLRTAYARRGRQRGARAADGAFGPPS